MITNELVGNLIIKSQPQTTKSSKYANGGDGMLPVIPEVLKGGKDASGSERRWVG